MWLRSSVGSNASCQAGGLLEVEVWMLACNMVAIFSSENDMEETHHNNIQDNNNIEPNSNGLQPRSGGLQPNRDGLQPCMQPGF